MKVTTHIRRREGVTFILLSFGLRQASEGANYWSRDKAFIRSSLPCFASSANAASRIISQQGLWFYCAAPSTLKLPPSAHCCSNGWQQGQNCVISNCLTIQIFVHITLEDVFAILPLFWGGFVNAQAQEVGEGVGMKSTGAESIFIEK